VPEIWFRSASGQYGKAATSSHYERTTSGNIIYWEPSTREFFAYSIEERKTQKLPDYKPPGYQGDIREDVVVSANRKGLEFGVKNGDTWKYQRLDLRMENFH
jgi:hypothetical protein